MDPKVEGDVMSGLQKLQLEMLNDTMRYLVAAVNSLQKKSAKIGALREERDQLLVQLAQSQGAVFADESHL